MTDLVLWRHGQTDYNAALRLQGQVDVPLNEEGRAQAQAAAPGLAALHPALLAASPLGRAQETAEALAGLTGLEVVTVGDLAERSFGVWEGLRRAEIKAGWPEQYGRWRAGQDPEGVDVEPRARVAERVGKALEGLVEQAGERDVVVAVAHGAAITLGASWLLGLDPSTWFGLRGVENCHHAVLRRSNRAPGWMLVGWNLPGTLPGPTEVPGAGAIRG
ncbi:MULTISPECIES: histidine phosphatase family protein [Actinomyces]|uniref:Histidine phosphatase family protein n=1 Tax=Actinomyces respiraculi TaxID=2744574 RepID=A0A7T0LJU8_9ACTO|nr:MULTISPECIES: histidine phosphatase family protein [Actinomyces]QPL04663.1 histidine phosphatase family protein [Actinomyces respiraculi]